MTTTTEKPLKKTVKGRTALTVKDLNEAVLDGVQDAIDYCSREQQKVRNSADAHKKLMRQGIYLCADRWDFRWADYTIEVHHLPSIRRALGKLEVTGNYELVQGKEKDGIIWVAVSPKDGRYSHFKFKYESKISKNTKCQLKETVHEPVTLERRTTYAVVCDAPK